MKKEALLYEKLNDKRVHCFLCSHHCKIQEGKYGICGVRQNQGGTLYTLVYGEVIAAHMDPIEKKPLYHFLPGSTSFSIATMGCNFQCGFCQNWQISQMRKNKNPQTSTEELLPDQIVNLALKNKCQSISYTYTEPTIFFEYAYETAQLAKEKGLYNVFVTNGYMTKEMLNKMKPYLDAANVDLKSFKDETYKRDCKARLQPVLETIKYMHELKIWIEITTLLIPGVNDSDEELENIIRFIVSVNDEIPWHISRFHPDYKFTNYQITSIESLKKAEKIGKKY